jgi:hypothetical protein
MDRLPIGQTGTIRAKESSTLEFFISSSLAVKIIDPGAIQAPQFHIHTAPQPVIRG